MVTLSWANARIINCFRPAKKILKSKGEFALSNSETLKELIRDFEKD